MLRAVEMEDVRRNSDAGQSRPAFRLKLCCLLIMLQLGVLISILVDPTTWDMSYSDLSPHAALLYVFRTTKVFIPAGISIGSIYQRSINDSYPSQEFTMDNTQFRNNSSAEELGSGSIAVESKRGGSLGSETNSDDAVIMLRDEDTGQEEDISSDGREVELGKAEETKEADSIEKSPEGSIEGSSTQQTPEESMDALAKSLHIELKRDPAKTHIGLCTRVRSMSELMEVKDILLASLASMPRWSFRGVAITVYVGVPNANLTVTREVVQTFRTPRPVHVVAVEAETPLAVVQLTVDLGEDFFVYVSPHGRFTEADWASTSLHSMELRMPRGTAFVNISSADRGIEGLFFNAKMFEAVLHGMFHSTLLRQIEPKAIADEMRDLYGVDALAMRRPFYTNPEDEESGKKSEGIPTSTTISESVDKAFRYAKQTLTSFNAIRGIAEKGMGAYKSWSDKEFRSFQDQTLSRIRGGMRAEDVRTPTNVLLVLTVSSNNHTVWQVEKLMRFFAETQKRQLQEYNSSDTVKFLINFYQPKTALWDRILKKWNGMVHGQRLGLTCKIHVWTHLNKHVVHGFDYVWLLDDDVDLTFFNWELARLILKRLDPLVAAPGILPMRKNGRTSYWEVTHAKPQFDPTTFSLSLARNVDFVEVMTPIISTKFWPVVFDRLKYFDLGGVYCIDCFWSQAATKWGGSHCGRRAPLVVLDLTPIVHTDLRTLGKLLTEQMKEGKRKKYAGCIRGPIQANLNVSKFTNESIQPVSSSPKYHRQTFYLLRNAVADKDITCPKQPNMYEPAKLWTALNV